jgi:hypothetical protein
MGSDDDTCSPLVAISTPPPAFISPPTTATIAARNRLVF